ncbi:MAG: cytochrome P450 [Steroidobacteraceae bacterium]
MSKTVLPDHMTDLLSAAAVKDPYKYFGKYRDISPVVWNPQWKGWIFTGNEAVREGLAGDTMTSDRIARFEDQLTSRAGGDENADIIFRTMSQWIVYATPPRHTHLRRLLSKPFSPRAVREQKAHVATVIAKLLDELEHKAKNNPDPVDLLHEYAAQVPARVIGRLMGVPDQDVPKLGHWSEELTLLILGALGAEDRHARAKSAFVELENYVREMVAVRRKNPGADIVSEWTQARDSEVGLTEEELIASCILVIFGGHETTMNLIANALLTVDQHPAARKALIEGSVDPSMAVEEFLRFCGPARSILRDVARDHEVAGQTLRTGERALFVLAAANYDPLAFADPDTLKLDRSPNRHVAFGTGIHQCLGAPLARLEAQVAIPEFVRRFPDYRVTIGDAEWQPLLMTRGLKALPATVL